MGCDGFTQDTNLPKLIFDLCMLVIIGFTPSFKKKADHHPRLKFGWIAFKDSS